jgi:DNA-binding helix-turn-helix protein
MIDFEKILKAKGKSKADLARFLDIDPSNVNRTIKNDNITLSKIENICSFLDISLIDAMRISGYDDTPGVIPEATKKEKVSEYKDLLLSLSDQLVDLYHKKILAPYSVVEEKEKEIKDLNREIGRLEADNERLKNDFRRESERAPQNNTIQDADSISYKLPENDSFVRFINNPDSESFKVEHKGAGLIATPLSKEEKNKITDQHKKRQVKSRSFTMPDKESKA